MVFQKNYSFTQKYPPVLATAEGLRSPLSAELDATLMTGFTGVDGRDQKIIPPGTFAGSTGTPGIVRPLPRVKPTSVIATDSALVSVPEGTAGFFQVGETLEAIFPYGTVTFSGTWAADDTVTLSWVLDAGTVEVTYTAVSGVLIEIANGFANFINSCYETEDFWAVSDGIDTVYIMTKGFNIGAVSTTAVTAGTGAVTDVAIAQQTTAIGTIASIDVLNNQITLGSNAAIALPAGFPIGVRGSNPAGLGMISPNQPVDAAWGADLNLGLYVGASVYEARLPYVDPQIKGLFPEIRYI